jgi:AcrR family transcriptional regulator
MASRASAGQHRRRAPRGTLSRDTIVKMAIKVIDAEGADALTLSRIANDLGVRTMALYTHFRDKNAIMLAVFAELFGRFRMPEHVPDDPIETLRRVMRAYFELLIENRALLHVDGLWDEISPGEARFYEAVYSCMASLHLERRTAAVLANTMIRFVIGCAYLHPLRHALDDPDLDERNRRRVTSLSAATYPAIHELSLDLPMLTQRESFEAGLEITLAAVANAAELNQAADQ